MSAVEAPSVVVSAAEPGAAPAQQTEQTPAPAPAQSQTSTPAPTETTASAPKDSKDKPAAAPAAGGDAPPKKLSGAELKALKQAEKAKRRAAVIAAKEAVGGPAAPVVPGPAAAAAGGQQKQAKSKGKQDDAASRPSADGAKITGPLARHPGPPGAAGTAAASAVDPSVVAELEKDPRAGIPECFSHLQMAKRITLSQAHKDVHPAVLAVGQQMASFTLRDNMARLEATLLAFKKVIESYKTPPGNAFSRHFVSHVLNPQIEYLIECRPMCFAMGNAIRLLKARVSQLDLDTDDADAIEDLVESINIFIQERIFVAAVGIAHEAASMIHDGDVVLTYGGPRLVRAALEKAWDQGMRFDLIVVNDSSDPKAGKDLAKLFQQRRSNDDDAYVTF